MKVKLLDWTDNGRELLFAAGRQCYADGWTGDWWMVYPHDNSSVCVIDPDSNEKFNDKEMDGLLNHLKSAGHTSVLEHAKFTFAIDGVSRALTHQLVRHRMASYSQQSQRYVSNEGDFDLDLFVIPPSIQRNDDAFKIYVDALADIQKAYNKLKACEIPSEDARYLMPNGSITRIVITMNCVSLLHFLSLRCCTAAQWEIRDLANKMLKLAKEKLPVVFEKAGSRCVSLGYCPEDKKRCCGKYPTRLEVLEAYKEKVDGNKRD